MKLLVIIDDLVNGGTENVLASRLANISKNFNVHIVTLYGRGPVAEVIEKLGFKVDFIDMGKLGYRQGISKLKEIIAMETPDLALCMRDVSRGLLPWFLKKHVTVVMFWDNPRIKRSFRQSVAEWFQVKFSGSFMYCCSNTTRQALILAYGPKKISVIHNCFDNRKFTPVLNEGTAGPIRIISVGNIREEKKHADKILIASLLKERGHAFTLEIIGQGDSSTLQDLIFKHGLQKEVFLRGEKNNINRLLQDSQIFLFTSQTEGFPVSLLEAMASGLPCITYRFPGLEEIDPDFSHLEVVPQGDIDTAVDKIIQYANNPVERKRLGEKGANFVAKHFSAMENTKQWEAYLLSLCSKNT